MEMYLRWRLGMWCHFARPSNYEPTVCIVNKQRCIMAFQPVICKMRNTGRLYWQILRNLWSIAKLFGGVCSHWTLVVTSCCFNQLEKANCSLKCREISHSHRRRCYPRLQTDVWSFVKHLFVFRSISHAHNTCHLTLPQPLNNSLHNIFNLIKYNEFEALW